MFNASDAMITEFERNFFSRVSRDQVIANHLESALKAQEQGNNNLRDIHLQYAQALQSNDPKLEVNTAAAVAS